MNLETWKWPSSRVSPLSCQLLNNIGQIGYVGEQLLHQSEKEALARVHQGQEHGFLTFHHGVG